MAKRPDDYELDFLKSCTKDELAPLVGILVGTDDEGNIDCSRLTSELDSTEAFKKYFPDHTKYVDEIIEDFQLFAGNSFARWFRGGMGVSYHVALCDVAKKLKVNFKKTQRTKAIETYLLAKVLEDAWEKMSEDEREEVLKDSGDVLGKYGGLTYGAAIAIFRAGGFNSYVLAYRLVSIIAKAVLGHGFKPVVMAGIGKWLAVLAGPVGWTITGIWAAVDIASTAYRVTIPACIYIAALRQMKDNEESVKRQKKPARKQKKSTRQLKKKNA